MGLAEQFTNLGEDFLGSFDARVNFLGKNIVDVKRLANATHGFLNKTRREHSAMGRKLRADLGAFVNDLTETVDSLRHKFQKQQRAVHQDCAAAHRSWEKVGKTMAAKRRNFKQALARAKQNAARAH